MICRCSASHGSEAEARSFSFSSEQRLEYPSPSFKLNATSGIRHFNQCVASHLTQANLDATVSVDRFNCVQHQIQYRVFDPCRVEIHENGLFRVDKFNRNLTALALAN